MYIRVGIVAESAGFNVAFRVDVSKTAAGGRAAVCRVSVIPEVNDQIIVPLTVIGDMLRDMGALLGAAYQRDIRVFSDRHVVKKPSEPAASAPHVVEKIITGYGEIISGVIAG